MSDPLHVRGVSTNWGGRPVLREITFDIAPGELVTLMGPNGSGKTTLLRAIAGLEPLTAGTIAIGERRVDDLPTHRRRIGLLFQEPTMLPRRTVRQNVAYGPELQARPPAEVDRTVDGLLGLLRLSGLAERSAAELSGGERQRVALARTLAAEPTLILMDEPFASVDAELRGELRADFRQILRERGVPVLHVTHDREEGLFLADRVLLISEGRLVQSGRPAEVVDAPATSAIARFLGYNLFRRAGRLVAVRPESLRLDPGASVPPFAVVVAAGRAGGTTIVYLRGENGERWECRSTDPTRPLPRGGDRLSLGWEEEVLIPSDTSLQ